ncbi:MAG: hypothetical protein LBH35_06980 [Treponema sp.]|nr:hypothetical protein [Treponema sp.]
MIRKLTERECRDAMEKGAFEPIEGTGALILTQSWCPQWKAMKNYLPDAEKAGTDVTILYIEYDTEAFFDKFMEFKENTYQNREIPYVRYFQKGVFSAESNYVSLQGFLHRLNLA